MRILISSMLALLLAGCAPGQLVSTAGGISATVLPPATVAQLQQTCTAAQPIIGVATATNAPSTVRSIAVYAQAYCTQLQAGTVPATTDANTPSWLASVLNAVQVAAQVAGMVMPILALF